MKTESVRFRLDNELSELLDFYSNTTRQSRSQAIRTIIWSYFERNNQDALDYIAQHPGTVVERYNATKK